MVVQVNLRLSQDRLLSEPLVVAVVELLTELVAVVVRLMGLPQDRLTQPLTQVQVQVERMVMLALTVLAVAGLLLSVLSYQPANQTQPLLLAVEL
jgi:hypothetical protein